MKILLTKILIALGLISFFNGTTNHFKVHASESGEKSSAGACDTVGGKTEGCGKSQ